jgi:glycosyltransferase involved in cell wall biosynthesis
MRDLLVAALTGASNDPSSRFRVRQYVPALRSRGITVEDHVSRFGRYPPLVRSRRMYWGAARLVEATRQAWASRRADVTLIQREMLSTLMTAEPLTRHPRVLDVDDAIWMTSRFGSIDAIARRCDTVICGNDFLAEYFGALAPHVEVVPTAVDTERWVPVVRTAMPELRIGWTGTSGNLRYLNSIMPAIHAAMNAVPHARLAVMSDRQPQLDGFPADRVDYQRWSSETEVQFVQSLTVGLMPLADGEWERGKCAYKMLLYLACGVPAIVSPVGANVQVLRSGGDCSVGIAASTAQQWTDAMVAVLMDSVMGSELGHNGRELVDATYSIRALAPQLAGVLRQLGSD